VDSVLSGIIPRRIYFSYGLYPTGGCYLTTFSFLAQSLFSLWILVPSFIVAQFGKDLAKSLDFAAQQTEKISSGKKN